MNLHFLSGYFHFATWGSVIKDLIKLKRSNPRLLLEYSPFSNHWESLLIHESPCRICQSLGAPVC
jgi:hypothetical protein